MDLTRGVRISLVEFQVHSGCGPAHEDMMVADGKNRKH